MRIVIVGASSGLGRCIAIGLGQRGESVALLARRVDRLEDAAKEAGPGSLAISCDVTDADSCRAAVDEAAAGLGGIDALVYTPGIGHLGKLTDTDADTWRRVFDTNVIGAALVSNAVIPHLSQAGGVVAYLSSIAGSLTTPWPGLATYATSKSALNTLIQAYQVENPTIGFTQVIVGDCAGGEGPSMTEFANNWSMDVLMEFHPQWEKGNLLSGTLMDVEELVNAVHAVVRVGASATIPTIAVVPRRAG
jgi:NAD(P)-dependent dehydrogenase (short-subunit alcohol dehydrogenase family)